jgi:peptidoglycan hydrolase-like protein with peptidoglycan-binding domain
VRVTGFTALLLALAFGAATATAAGDARVAAVQVALYQRHLYHATIDGIDGPSTRHAVLRLQRRKRLVPDGEIGPQTLVALGGPAPLGARVLARGMKGLDVAALQFALAWHGFPSGRFDGRFGWHTHAALSHFQHWSGLAVDGLTDRATVAALRRPLPASPIHLAFPVAAPIGDMFGPRGVRFHAGIDLTAFFGAPVTAAAAGRVAWAGWRGGWGKLVVLVHDRGLRTLYAHLSRINVRLRQRIAAGATIGRVGATGHATGPHLHFEVRLRGAAVDPLTALDSLAACRSSFGPRAHSRMPI